MNTKLQNFNISLFTDKVTKEDGSEKFSPYGYIPCRMLFSASSNCGKTTMILYLLKIMKHFFDTI
jgi:hypothetical protein